ncbi:MAG: hypothetical protein IJJ86_05995 [Clostridia bacterium]|nr:hypothetical protein [Clostridia bacterium]
MKETHTGWTAQEDAALAFAAAEARRQRQPLKTAFDAIALETNRRPNSVRNHYYTQLKPNEKTGPVFLPFSEEETDRLLETVLLALSNGQSVRACTLAMANGDTRRMLRFQNKYRSLLKSRPERVRSMRAKLVSEGHAVPDPFLRDPGTPHVGRPPKTTGELERRIRALLDALCRNLLALTQDENAV